MSKKNEWTLASGNRCGHKRDGSTLHTANPIRKDGKGAHPKLLVEANDIFDQMFHTPRKFLKNLFLMAPDENGKSRLHRSEFRESLIKVMKTLVKFFDIATCRIAVPDAKGDLQNITLKLIARHSGLNLKRTERAWTALKNAGIVMMKPVVEENENGEKRAKAAFKWMSVDFFQSIGLGKWFKAAREKFKGYVHFLRQKAAERRAAKTTTKADQAAQKMQLKGMMSKIFNPSSRVKARSQQAREAQLEREVEYKRQAHGLALQLHRETGVSIAECLEHAYEKLKA